MHLAIVSRYAERARGGHERYLQRLSRGLIERGHQISYFSSCFDEDFEQLTGLTTVQVPLIKFPQPLRYLSFNYFARRAVNRSQAKFDFVFTTEYLTFGDIYRAGAGIQRAEIDAYLGKTALLSPKSLVKIYLQKKLFSNPPPVVLANSRKVQQQLQEYFQLPPEKLFLLYNGTDLSRFSPKDQPGEKERLRAQLKLTGDETVLLISGSNIKRKGLDRAVELLNNLGPEYHLILTGSPDQKKLLDKIRSDRRQQLHLIGHSETMEQYYRLSDWTLVLSRYDPAPNVVLESIASGTPVLTTEQSGLSELVAEEQLGAVVNSKFTVAEITNFLDDYEPEEYPELSRRCRLSAKKFSQNNHLDNIEAILHSHHSADADVR